MIRVAGSVFAALVFGLLAAPAIAEGQDPRDALFFGDEEEAAPASPGSKATAAKQRDQTAESGDPRDDLFFGDDGTISTSAPADQPVTTEEEREEGRLLASDEIERRLGVRDNQLDIGGLLYLRMGYGAASEGIPETFPVNSPNLLDLYLDARPTDRLRAFVRGRVTHSFAAEEPALGGFGGAPLGTQGGTQVALDQLWLKFDVDHRLYVTAGRQPIRWGASRFWNPTDFLNVQRRDPLAVLDERLGVSLLKLHLPLEASGWNFYAIANLENATLLNEIGGALRAEKLIGSTEITVSAGARRDQPLLLGADISFPAGPFDLRAEVAVSHGDDRTFFRGPVGWDPLRIPTTFSREDEWIPQAVVGAEVSIAYSEEDSLNLGTEYFYNGAGYDDTDLYPFLIFTGDFTPLYLGRHYAAVYASAIGPGSWNDTTLIASVLGNLNDGSFLSRFDWRVRILTYLDFNAFVAWHFGSEGEFHFGLDLPPLAADADLAGTPYAPLQPFLQDGLRLVPPLLDLGVGLSLRF